MSDQVGNPEDRFSQNEAHIYKSFAFLHYIRMSASLLIIAPFSINLTAKELLSNNNFTSKCISVHLIIIIIILIIIIIIIIIIMSLFQEDYIFSLYN